MRDSILKTPYKLVSAALLCGVLAGCTTSPEQAAAAAEAQRLQDEEIASRKGESVSRICPRTTDSWRAFGDDYLLIEARNEWYILELLGTCDPDSAFSAIATRGASASSCIERGDDIFTGRPRSGERCVITSLHTWNDDPISDQEDGAE